jgi:hypothetical protein
MHESWRPVSQLRVLGLAAVFATTVAYSVGIVTPPANNSDVDDGAIVAAAPVSATTHLAECRITYDRLKSEIIDVFRRTSRDAPALRDRAITWLEHVAAADSDLGGAPSYEALVHEGNQLVEDSCDHPLIIGYVAACNLSDGHLKLARERHGRAAPPLMAGEYGPLPRFFEASRLMRLSYFAGRAARHASERVAGEAWIDVAAQNDHREWERILWSDLCFVIDSCSDREGADRLLNDIAADERISEWLRSMAAGKAANEKAWVIRGGGYANEIDGKNWAPFYKKVAEAKEHYTKAHELEPERPEAATQLIRVVNAEPDGDADSLRHWFDEARAAQVDYLPAYENLLWGMLPHWHGSYESMYKLAQQWQAEGLFATDAPSMSARAVFDIGRNTGGWDKPLQSEGPYTLAVSVMQSMADDPQHDASVRRCSTRACLLSEIVSVALKSGHNEDALAALQTLDDDGLELDLALVRKYEIQPERALPRLYAISGKASEAVTKLEALSDGEKRGGAATLSRTITAYEAAKREADDRRADPYFDHTIRVCSLERDFIHGGWASPSFDAALTDWYRPTVGIWEVESATSVVARQSDESGAPTLWTECRLGQHYEVELLVEPIYESGPESVSGVFIGGNPHGYFFHVNRSARKAAVSLSVEDQASASIDDQPSYKLSVRVWPNHGELWIDGEKVIDTPLKDFNPSGHFSLASVPRYGGSEVRYSNVRFRKLEPRTESDAAEPEADNE